MYYLYFVGTLNKLTKLVRRQGLFDDPTEEINNLIYRIKQDLDDLNNKCDSAQKYIETKKAELGGSDSKQSTNHNMKVVSQLKTNLMNTTKDFKSILEVRSSKMKDQQQRKFELTGKGALSPMTQISANKKSNDRTKIDKNDHSYNNYDPESGGSISGGTGVMQGQQALLLAPPIVNQYYESREQAVTEVEKTIAELGNLFKRLSTMISEQQELVERIDDDIESSVTQANNAHSVLLKAYENVSSNGSLYAKLGGILVLFIIFFSIFLL